MYAAFTLGVVRTFELAFVQHKQGNYDEDVWRGLKNQMLEAYQTPGIRECIDIFKSVFGATFVKYLETESLNMVRSVDMVSFE